MQVVIITGVAQGMGREVALRLAAAGDAVAGFDVDAAGVDSLRAELAARGSDCLLTTLDVCDRPGILAFRDAVLRRRGRADVVLSPTWGSGSSARSRRSTSRRPAVVWRST